MRKALALSVVFLGPLQAFGLEAPTPSPLDQQMKTVDYNPNNQTDLYIAAGRSATIEFRPQECVKWDLFGEQNGPASGLDSKDLKEPMRNINPIFGNKVGVTNLNIVTADCDQHENEHNYSLLIHVVATDDANTTTRHLKYTYAAQDKQKAQKVAQVSWKVKREAAEHDKLIARLAVEPFYQGPKGRNYKYIATGDSSITPVINGGTSDNYSMTAFRFPGNMEAPAILVADGAPTQKMCERKENPSKDLLHSPEHTVSVRPQDDWIIVQQTAAHWRFRLGNGPAGKVADVFSCGYDPIGYNPGTGTESPDVIREVIGPKEIVTSR